MSTEKKRCRPIFLTGSAAAREFCLAETNLRFRYFESDLRPGSGPVFRENSDLLSSTKPKPSDALFFAESLLLCPTVEQAQARIQLDQVGARAFLTFADHASEILIERLSVAAAERYSQQQTKFFALAGFVLDFLERSKQARPEEWE